MASRLVNWFRFSSPATFFPLARKIGVVSTIIAVALIAVGLYMSFFVAPTDYKQGEGYRIIFVHVPASWMSMFIYLVMAGWAALGLIFNTRLWTGSFWGKPMWGTWWVWDARITSELILLFLYLGYMALRSAIDDPRRADRASAILLLVGVVNVPIIYYSVQWWNTLHQGSTIRLNEESTMDDTMLVAMLIMTLGFWAYSIAVAMSRLRTLILERERSATWVRELASREG